MRRLFFSLATFFLTLPLFASSNAVPFLNTPLVPSTVAPGSASFTLTVNGTGFVSGAVVNWNGAPLPTTFVSQGSLTAFVSKAKVAKGSTAVVTVTNPAPGGGTSSPDYFTVTKPSASLTFAPSILSVGASPANLVTGDFNNDKKIDLAVLNLNQPNSCYLYGGEGTIQVFAGDGTGAFSSLSEICLPDGLGTRALPYLLAADLNSDGKLDLSYEYSFPGSVSLAVSFGNGDGTFTGGGGIGGEAIGPAIFADFNQDGTMDMAIIVGGVSYPCLFVGSLTGSTGECVDQEEPLIPIVTGDFNNDGILDLALDDPGVFIGKGDWTFQEGQPLPACCGPYTAGDFNADGNLDLAGPDVVLLGHGDGTFALSSFQGGGLAAADLNGDGKLDLVSLDSGDVLIYIGNGDGTFQAALKFPVGNGPTQVAVADFNDDGRLDLAVTNNQDNTVSILLQSPAVTISPKVLKFGKEAVGKTSNARRVSLTNSGSAALNVSNVVMSGDFTETNNCGRNLAFGKICQISVAFRPKATGLRTGSVTITDNAGNSPQVIQLSGVGD